MKEIEATDKKQILLRLSKSLYNDINRWSEDDFRSVNGQIEFILSQAVLKRKKAAQTSSKEDLEEK